jgi:hypothetical protein
VHGVHDNSFDTSGSNEKEDWKVVLFSGKPQVSK